MNLALQLSRAIDPLMMSEEDAALIAEAGAAWPNLGAADLNRETLAEIARERGVDHAMALLYARLCEDQANRDFIESLCGPKDLIDRATAARFKLLVMPAALYREFPKYGGDGSILTESAARLGMQFEVIPSLSAAGAAENAQIIGPAVARAVERAAQDEPRTTIILASLSKGGADLRHAYGAGLMPEDGPVHWLQFSGMLRGSPLANDVLYGNWLRRAFVQGFLRAHGGRRDMLSDMAHDASAEFMPGLAAPEGVRVYNMLGLPLHRHLSGQSLRRHGRLAPLGPNDGMTLSADAMLRPGAVAPIWGSNHYFQNFQGRAALLDRTLSYICREAARGITARSCLAATPVPAEACS